MRRPYRGASFDFFIGWLIYWVIEPIGSTFFGQFSNECLFFPAVCRAAQRGSGEAAWARNPFGMTASGGTALFGCTGLPRI
jgi:hypothetical protein